MKPFKAQSQQENYSEPQDAFEDLNDQELEAVNGGLNPQPLPPRIDPGTYSLSDADPQGIIVIGGIQ
ncbi:MAG: hypothetical protein NVS4B9_34230 [Ktedonobacteraceae bacterium]